MKTLSEYNLEKYASLQTDLRESRLKKVARLIVEENIGHILDIGCGNGGFSSRFIALGFTVHGVDLTESQISAARGSGLIAKQHDIASSRLPYEDGTFDIVFAGEVIEHLVDTTSFLKEIHRVLKSRGCVILTTPNLASFENRMRILFGVYPIWVEYKLEDGQGHVRAYTPRTLKLHLKSSGFDVETHLGNWVPFIPQRFTDDVRMPLISKTGDWLPSLSMDIIVKARKP
jgi:2-polyprenyl-3-methyl-5-hydroxy-6-metoxy-1,4-benzoquinol methylase